MYKRQVSFNATIDAHLAADRLADASALVAAMTCTPNAATFRSLMRGALRLEDPPMALELWHRATEQQVPPDIDLVNMHLEALCRTVQPSALPRCHEEI